MGKMRLGLGWAGKRDGLWDVDEYTKDRVVVDASGSRVKGIKT
jgi:hypothetical protein